MTRMQGKLTDFELGWLIGILEGEACFDYQTSNSARIRIAMTDEDTILRVLILLQRITGRNHQIREYSPQSRKETERRRDWQQAYAIAVYGKDAVKVMRLIVKHMSVRRRKRIWQTINGHRPKKQTVKLDIEDLVSNIVQMRKEAS